MPLSYQVLPSEGLVSVKGAGAVDLREAQRLLREALADPAVRPGMGVLIDLAAMEWPATTQDMKALVGSLPALPAPYPGAIAVVVSTSFHFGMARMAAILAEPKNIEISVYMDMNDARACLRRRPAAARLPPAT